MSVEEEGEKQENRLNTKFWQKGQQGEGSGSDHRIPIRFRTSGTRCGRWQTRRRRKPDGVNAEPRSIPYSRKPENTTALTWGGEQRFRPQENVTKKPPDPGLDGEGATVQTGMKNPRSERYFTRLQGHWLRLSPHELLKEISLEKLNPHPPPPQKACGHRLLWTLQWDIQVHSSSPWDLPLNESQPVLRLYS